MTDDPDVVALLLGPSATTPERVTGLMACGLTQEHIGQACGVSSRLVDRWVRGESIPLPDRFYRLDDLRALCRYAIEISSYRLEFAGELLIRLKVPGLVVERRFNDALTALRTLELRARKAAADL